MSHSYETLWNDRLEKSTPRRNILRESNQKGQRLNPADLLQISGTFAFNEFRGQDLHRVSRRIPLYWVQTVRERAKGILLPRSLSAITFRRFYLNILNSTTRYNYIIQSYDLILKCAALKHVKNSYPMSNERNYCEIDNSISGLTRIRGRQKNWELFGILGQINAFSLDFQSNRYGE